MNLIDQLGIVPIYFEADSYEVEVELTDFHAQPQGFLNGSVSLALAEISAGMASNQLIDEGYFAFGQSLTAEHLRTKVAQGRLIAKGELLHHGRSSHVWDIRISDEAGKLISHVSVTNHISKIN